MNFRKAQTATEYIVIISVVIVIALVVVQIMGGFPGIGSSTSKKFSDYKLSNGDLIGIEKYYFGNGSVLVTIKNNYFEALTVNNLTIAEISCNSSSFSFTLNPGQSKTINCTGAFTPSQNNDGTPSLIATYTNLETGASYTTSASGTVISNPPTTYIVTYDGNGNDGGTVPVDNTAYAPGAMFVPASANSVTRAGYTAMGWNSQADGLGIDRSLAFYINSSQTLYVKWAAIPTYTVTYFGNNNTGGTAPTDSNNYQAGALVNVSTVGSLTRNGYTFLGWNTQANGSGNNLTAGSNFTMGSGNVNLYAKWGTYQSVIPSPLSAATVKATTYYLTGTENTPWYTFNTTLSLINAWQYNQWMSDSLYITNQKLNVDLGSAHIITRIYYENGHNYGGNTNAGGKNVIFYGTNDAVAFNNLVYGNLTNLTQLWSGTFNQHTSSNSLDPQYISLSSNAVAYRYYVFRFADNYGSGGWIGVRRIELQEIQ